ncbi:hypothetical protein IWQ56_001075 [Coemansia nantahalensis]|uniref:Uncharacterized protein n=1 Tax=Coemansia helicoidea TaxID=1286919 RepID=A0ACC1LEX6_9FUNG|nr:hypothetical protein IWQ56_001075 [Coemansia nantahalensis]KAJ2807093.1 hypothetical protein H4R21_000616 [Coemansia helicoidea]
MVRLAACGSCLARAAGWATWAATLLVAAVPAAWMVRIAFSAFAAPYIVRHVGPLALGDDQMCQLSWKEPFEYEARVYASQQRDALNASADFFETSQLLWHIPPTSLSNRFPLHRRTATAVLPRAFSIAYNRSLEMHIHIFVQRAGQFSPHPNITDPHLAYSSYILATQNRLQTINTSPGMTKDSLVPDDTFMIRAFPRIAWAIMLDDYPFRLSHLSAPRTRGVMPGRNNSNDSDDDTPCVYNPHIHINIFTDNVPEPSPLVVRRDYRNLAQARKRKVSVEMELRGIRTGWMVMKGRWLQIYPPNGTQDTAAAGPATDSGSLASALSARAAQWGEFVTREYLYPLSVPTLLATSSLMVLGLVASLVYVKAAAAFWLGPTSRWAGVSRASVAAELASALIYVLRTDAFFRDAVYLWCLVRYSLFAAAMAVELLAVCRRMHGSETSSTASGSAGAAGGQGQAGRIVAARVQVDREAWWWLSRAVAPLALVVYLAAAQFLLRDKLWSAKGASAMAALCMRTLYTLHIVPQIVLNARLRSGVLMPAVVPLSYSLSRVFFVLAYSMSGGYSGKSELVNEGIGHIGAAVLVAQWAWYRKPKVE